MHRVSGNGTLRPAPPLRPAIPCDPDAIPAALKELDQWVTWRYIARGGRPTKVPTNARTGREASSTDPSTWSSFTEAVSALGDGSSNAGIGFVFSPDDPFCGIDLDECLEEGAPVPEARAIVDTFNTYTEVSPSGNGVKLFLRGRKPPWARCRSKAIRGFKETEVYDSGRFFTVTGRRLPGIPVEICDRQQELEALCGRLWPPAELSGGTDRASRRLGIEDDEELLERMFSSRHGAGIRRLWDGDIGAHGGDHSAADLALCNHLAFWTGRDRERMDRLFRRSGLYREKWQRADYRNWTLDRAVADCREAYSGDRNGKQPRSGKRRPPWKQSTGNGVTPTIHIDVDEHRVIAETIAALTADRDLYQRGNLLVRVLRERHSSEGVIRPEGSATIVQVPTANLRDRMTEHARFIRNEARQGIVPSHPPLWLVAGVDARGEWPGIRHLMGVSDTPILRADGSVWQTPGYDDVTGVLFEPLPGVEFPHIRPRVSAEDARSALTQLLEVVCDFRFEAQEHQAAWIAALLTPLARFAFAGPTPLFLIDANVRGAGKGLLAQTVGQIVLGREMPVSSYAHDADEMRKKVTTLALAGDRMVLLDNLAGGFGNDALDRALTTTRWKDRILGKSAQVDLPLLAVWYATGNNVQVGADTARRIIHLRLDVLEERPEDRTGYRHPDLISWVKRERGRLLTAALTILSAFIRAGLPDQHLTPFGSFEGWSRLVRQAVVWIGLPDPCLTRVRLAESADATADALKQLIDAWRQYDPVHVGIVIAEALAKLYPADGQYQSRDVASIAMRAALENAVGCPPGRAPSNRQVGNKLKSFRRRVLDGWFLDTDDTKTKHGARWRLMRATSDGMCRPAAGDSADSGDSVSPPSRVREEWM